MLFAAALYLIGIGCTWSLGGPVGIMLPPTSRDVQTAMNLAGGQPAGRHPGRCWLVAFCWALPGPFILFCTARAADVCRCWATSYWAALGVRLQQLTVLRFLAPVLLTRPAFPARAAAPWIVGLMAPHGAFRVLSPKG